MIIAQINDYFNFSTGGIMRSIAQTGLICGHEIYCFAPNLSKKPIDAPGYYAIGNIRTRERHRRLAELTGLNGMFSFWATLRMLRRFDDLNVELIHLHNLQGFCVNLPLLFRYIKKRRILVVWTLHGTWAYTGKCVHHVIANCDKWKTSCFDCPQKDTWPASKPDNSRWMWRLKKKMFTSVPQMEIVAPSQWIAGMARESFLRKYPVRVIHNGINPYVFRPMDSDFRRKNGLDGKIVLLGVAEAWGKLKGFDTMLEIAERLGEDYRMVLVGTIKEPERPLPSNVVAIPHVNSKKEIAQIYTAADLFVQPTLADTFPTVNMEALACGTPVITFRTGGSPEIIDETCGVVVAQGDVDGLVRAIQDEVKQCKFTKENCLRRASQFTIENMVNQYLQLYSDMLSEKEK